MLVFLSHIRSVFDIFVYMCFAVFVHSLKLMIHQWNMTFQPITVIGTNDSSKHRYKKVVKIHWPIRENFKWFTFQVVQCFLALNINSRVQYSRSRQFLRGLLKTFCAATILSSPISLLHGLKVKFSPSLSKNIIQKSICLPYIVVVSVTFDNKRNQVFGKTLHSKDFQFPIQFNFQ